MKKAFYIFLLITFSKQFFGQTAEQGLSISVNQLTKSGFKPIIDATVDLIINDTYKYTLTSDAKGKLSLIKLDEGSYTIKIDKVNLDRTNCDVWGTTNIIIKKGEVSRGHINYACGNNRYSPDKQGVKDFWYSFFHIIFGISTHQTIKLGAAGNL